MSAFKNNILRIILLFAILGFAGCSSKKGTKITGTRSRVTSVVNGSTVKLASGIEVKLIGVKGGELSKDFLQEFVIGKQVTLIADSKDPVQTIKSSNSKIRAYLKSPEFEGSINSVLIGENRYSEIDYAHLKDSLESFSRKTELAKMSGEELAHYITPRTLLIQTETSSGTGFLISKDGLALTNNHVLDGTENAVVYLSDSRGDINEAMRRRINRIVTTNEPNDYTIFYVSPDGTEEFACLPLCDREPRRGEHVAVVGNPLGELMTFSQGSLSAVRSNEYGYWIQFTAEVNKGNSGGPIVTEKGQVVGVVQGVIVDPNTGTVATGNLNYGVDIRVIRQYLDNVGLSYAGK